MAEDSEHPEDQVRGARGQEDEALIGQYAAMIGQYAAMIGQYTAMIGQYTAMIGQILER